MTRFDDYGRVVYTDDQEWEDALDAYEDAYYEDCPNCGGAHWIELYDEDPLWYDEDDMAPCGWCNPDGKIAWVPPW